MKPRRAVVLGAQMTQVQEHSERGIPRYVAEHVRALGHVAPDLIARIDLDPARPLPGSIGHWQTSMPIAYQTLPDGREHARLYHVMSPFEYLPIDRLWPRWAHAPHVKLVVTLYDLIPLLYAEYYLPDPEFRQTYLARLDLIRAADAVLAISDATATDAVDHLGIDPARIHVIHAGCSPFFGPPARPAQALVTELQQTLPALRDDFFFCTGGIDFRKNLEGLIAGYARLPAVVQSARQLVITCRTTPADEARLRGIAASFGVNDQLILTGWVTDDVLRLLYQACGLFVFPAFYEGFGLPVVEAMRCGAPVIAANSASLPAIVRDPEARFDAASPADMAAVMLRAVNEAAFLERLRSHSAAAAGAFRWEDVAERSVTAYRALLDPLTRRRCPAASRRERWALFSPMPPQATGIADYTSRLAAALVETCDVDVFVDGNPEDFAVPDDPRVRLLAQREFRPLREIARYDCLLHCLGNSQFHQHAWEALMQYGGSVLLHEVQLANLYTSVQASGAVPAGMFADTLVRQYGDRLAMDIVKAMPTLAGLSSMDASRRGIFMAGDCLRRADRVLVHTEAARHLALLEAPEIRDRLHVVPFLSPPLDPSPAGHSRITVTTFGIVSETKGASLFASACAHLVKRLPAGARFVFAGDIDEHTAASLRRLFDALEITASMEITGRLSRDEYRRRLHEATVAVQLRTHAHGEMSAAVGDCLAAGLPTIVSDLGGLSELPSDVVVTVPAAIDDRTLASTIADLVGNRDRRASLRARALDYAAVRSPDVVAHALREALGRPALTGDPARSQQPSATPLERQVQRRERGAALLENDLREQLTQRM